MEFGVELGGAADNIFYDVINMQHPGVSGDAYVILYV